MPRIVDARGLACPQPVVLTKKVMETENDIITIVDNNTAVENVSRLAKSQGFDVSVEEKEGEFHLRITGTCTIPAEIDNVPITQGTVLLIGSDTMGRGEEELGGILIRSFFNTLNGMDSLPLKIIFVNRGVKLIANPSEVVEDLKALCEKGVEVLACGTCLEFFKLKNDIQVGQISNMYAIAESLLRAGKVVAL